MTVYKVLSHVNYNYALLYSKKKKCFLVLYLLYELALTGNVNALVIYMVVSGSKRDGDSAPASGQ